jgi:hypothetical protein
VASAIELVKSKKGRPLLKTLGRDADCVVDTPAA